MDWRDGPIIKSWPGETFIFEHTDAYDVYEAVKMVNADPESFQFGMIKISDFWPLLEARGNYDKQRVATMSSEDMFRPVLFATEPTGATRLIDGYHRSIRCHMNGEVGVAAWILSKKQTKMIWRPAPSGKKFY